MCSENGYLVPFKRYRAFCGILIFLVKKPKKIFSKIFGTQKIAIFDQNSMSLAKIAILGQQLLFGYWSKMDIVGEPGSIH